jgi:hypothetical protein
MKIITIVCAAGLLLFAACKKDKNDPSPEQVNRVREILGATEAKVFFYEQDRLIRINSDAGYSIRFTYSPSEIIVQVYSSNDQPDPLGKYSFTLDNGRIASGRKYLPNGAVVHEYGYQYDNEQRLSSVTFSIKDFTGNDTENHSYQLVYDDGNNLQQLAFKRKVDGINSDSSSVTFTRFTGKSFITWKNMRFDYFGKAAVGHQLQGMVPIPFSLVDEFYPAQNAIKSVETKSCHWNPNSGNWSIQSLSSDTWSETDYQYNELGWLTKYMDYTIAWDD